MSFKINGTDVPTKYVNIFVEKGWSSPGHFYEIDEETGDIFEINLRNVPRRVNNDEYDAVLAANNRDWEYFQKLLR